MGLGSTVAVFLLYTGITEYFVAVLDTEQQIVIGFYKKLSEHP